MRKRRKGILVEPFLRKEVWGIFGGVVGAVPQAGERS